MAKKRPTIAKSSQNKNPAKKYVSYDTFLQDSWTRRRTNFPFLVSSFSAYGIVIADRDRIKKKIYHDSSSEIIQENFKKQISEAITRMLSYYNKVVDETNVNILEPVAILKDIHIQSGANLFYVIIDAATFDSIPDRGNYVLTPISSRTSINKLAEDYREYFRVVDKTSKGQRARIAEILRINNVDILTPDIDNVKEWMGELNYGKSTPQKKDVRLNPGTEIYLPNVEPDFDKVVNGGQVFRMRIGDIQAQIAQLSVMMENFRQSISNSDQVVKVLDTPKQAKLLQSFFPKIRSHLVANDYDITRFLEDEEELVFGISENYELVYVALSAEGSLAYLNKGLPGLIVDTPFNDPRTMNFLLNLDEISLYNPSTYNWQDFVEDYVFPPVVIETRTSDDLMSDFTDTKKTIMQQLAERFDKFPIKNSRILDEENDILDNPTLLRAAAEENAAIFRNTGDAVVSNLVDISAKLDPANCTPCGAAATVFSEVLNKIDYKKLAASALDCIKDQVPFDCEDVILSVANIPEVQIGSYISSGGTVPGLLAVNHVFKSRMNTEQKEIATESYEVASRLNFSLYEGKYQSLEENFSDRDPEENYRGEVYLAALQLGFSIRGDDYNSVFQEACSILSNPIDLIPEEVFNIPAFNFPKIPTVDLDKAYFSTMETAILDMISSLIVDMITGLINTILTNCVDQEQQLEDSSDDPNNPNLSDLTSAIANNVGDENLAKTLEDLLIALRYSDYDDPEEDTEDTDASGETSFELEVENTAAKVRSIVSALKDFFEVLNQTFSDSMKIISLLEGYAPGNMVQQVLDIIREGNFTYGVNNEQDLSQVVTNEADVRRMFEFIAKIVDIQPIITNLNAAVGKVGCDNINDFISKRIALWCENIPTSEIAGYAENLISSSFPPGDLGEIVLAPFDTPPLTCQDNFGGSVSKDPASFAHALGQVLDRFFEPVYMSYDASALTLPDPYYSEVDVAKTVDRVVSTTAGFSLDYFNFAKLQEEKIKINPAETFGKDSAIGQGLQKLGIKPPGDIESLVMNPEFSRLLATGYVPESGVVDGVYGPYTTAVPKHKAESSFFGLTPQNLELDPVQYIQKVSQFAPRSRNVFENLDDRIKTFDATYAVTNQTALVLETSEPTDPTDKTRTSLNALKLEMFDDNSWRLNVGETLPNVSQFAPFSPAAVAAGSAPSSFEIAGNSYSSEAVYNFEYSGQNKFPEKSRDLLEYIESRTPPVSEGEIPQIKSLSRFIVNVMSNANRGESLSQNQITEIERFTKEHIFADCFKQMTFGVAKHCLSSPMFRFSEDNGAPLMSIVDWAPLPNEEDIECGYDPHILSLDTMKRRIAQDYENKIECRDLSKEINVQGLNKDNKTVLEEAMMSGIVMTTLRAYALEQLMKSIFPVSAFPCKSFLSPVIIKFIINRIVEELKDTNADYYEDFLGEVENVFADRMGEFSPYGTIPQVIADGTEMGIDWLCADSAMREFLAQTPIEEGAVTLPSGEQVEINSSFLSAFQDTIITDRGDAAEALAGGVTSGGGLGGFLGGSSGTSQPSSGAPMMVGLNNNQSSGAPMMVGLNNNQSSAPSFTDSVGQGFNQSPSFAEPPATVEDDVPTIANKIEEWYVPPSSEGPKGPLNELQCPEGANSVGIDKDPLEEIVEARLCFLIEEQLYSVLDKLQDLVSLNGEFSFDDRFISKNMPLLDVVKDNIQVDGSRFFGGDSDQILSMAQSRVNSAYDVYLEKYDEWHTANGNWAMALAAAPLSIVALGLTGAGIGALVGVYGAGWGAIVGAIIGAAIGVAVGSLITLMGGPLLLMILQGILKIPVPKKIFDEELEQNPEANVFYTGANGTKYVYTDTDVSRMVEKFISAFVDFIKGSLEAALDSFKPPNAETFNIGEIADILGKSADILKEAGDVAVASAAEAADDIADAAGALAEGDISGAIDAGADLLGFGAGDDPEDAALDEEVEELADSVNSLGETTIDFLIKSQIMLAAGTAAVGAAAAAGPLMATSVGLAAGGAAVGSAPLFAAFIDIFEVDWNREWLAVQPWNAGKPEDKWRISATGAFVNHGPPKVNHFFEGGINPLIKDQITIVFNEEGVMKAMFDMMLDTVTGVAGAGADAFAGMVDGQSLVPYPKLEDFAGDLSIPEEGLLARDDLQDTLVLTNPEIKNGSLEVGRGQVIAEKYVKTTGQLPGDPPSRFAQDSFSGQRYSREQSEPLSGRRSAGEVTSLSQILSPREIVDTSSRNCATVADTQLGLPVGVAPTSNTSLGGELDASKEKIWNIDEFQEYLESNNLELSNVPFEKVSFGMRLTYIAPPHQLLSEANDQALLSLQKRRLLPGSTEEFVFDESLAEREKCFIETERYMINKAGDIKPNVEESGKGPVPHPILIEPKAEQSKRRYLHTFPLYSVEKTLESASGIPRDDILSTLGISTSRDMQKVFSLDYEEFLKTELRNSEVYSLLFKYCVPGDNILSFVSVMANLTNELSDTFFDGTKYQLQNLFETTANAGDYTFKTSDERKKGGNRGEYARAQANYGTEGMARSPALFDLAVKTPKIIFKGLAEFIDPVINPASKIVKAGAAGKLIPQVMKNLNPDGSPGGVEDDNYFLTNLILPPGAVPPPVGPLDPTEPTVIRKTRFSLPISEPILDGAKIRNDGEIVVFRFRDKMTKSSESGNILFDRYMQKVFLKNYNPAPGNADIIYNNYKSNFLELGGLRLPQMSNKQFYFQQFALANINRLFPAIVNPLLQAYKEDLEVVRKGIILEIPEASDYLFDFSPLTFQSLNQLSKSDEQVRCIRDNILSIIKGTKAVNPNNFMTEGNTLATGFLTVFNPESNRLETVSGQGRVIDWIIWGEPSGNFLMPESPLPEVIFPGYPVPLPITPIAMSLLPCDVFPYSPFPPHSPLGHIYHAIAATDNLQNLNIDLKEVQRNKENIENKKKIREKLCIDMERLSSEEKKRRGLE